MSPKIATGDFIASMFGVLPFELLRNHTFLVGKKLYYIEDIFLVNCSFDFKVFSKELTIWQSIQIRREQKMLTEWFVRGRGNL